MTKRTTMSGLLLHALSSIRITVTCLFLLFILTFWGTVAQVNEGLYLSQERFFNSLVFLVGGWLPFPGARLVIWVLFINLLCVTITRFRHYKLSTHFGILIIHFGLLLYFVSAFVTFHGAQESQLTLMEGAGSNVSSAYHDWELSVWTNEADPNKRRVVAFDTKSFRPGQVLKIAEFGFDMIVKSFYPNAQALKAEGPGKEFKVNNASGIDAINSIPLRKEPERNFPGLILKVKQERSDLADVLLFGGESNPTMIESKKKVYALQLRRKRMELPFVFKLKEFKMEVHPNTQIARSYESLVEIQSGDSSREVLISMNKPLRYKNFTFYQASYAIDGLGRELSTLAVVRNSGRLLPYVASLLTFVGLALHFLSRAFQGKKTKSH